MVTEQTLKEAERRRLVCQVAHEYQADHEARVALMGLIVRVVDDMRFGMREINVDEIQTLASAWQDLNIGQSPSELGVRLLGR